MRVGATKLIFGFGPCYCVDRNGNVWSKKRGRWRQLRPTIGNVGYLVVNIKGPQGQRPYLVHRLVLLAFMGPCPKGMEARHLNGVRSDCCLSNLKWGTKSQNMFDKVVHGTSNRGERCATAKLARSQVEQIKELNSIGIGYRKLSKQFDVSVRTVYDIMKGKTWEYSQ